MSRGAKHVELCVFRGQALQVSKLHVLVWIWIVVSCKDTMIAALLGKNDVDEIDQAHVKITAALNLVVTQAKAVKGAVNDLLAAKRSREKEVERQQPAKTQSHRIDKLPFHLFCKASLCVYADALALTTNAPDGMHPCLVSAPPVPCMTGGVFTEHVGAFKAQFPTTSAAKSTGRAQCSFRPAALKAEVGTFMRKLSPWVTPDLSNFDEVAAELSLFGGVQGMSFVSSEWNGMGQVRYLLEGSRKVFAAPCGWLVQAARKVGKDVQTEDSPLVRAAYHSPQRSCQHATDCQPCPGSRPTGIHPFWVDCWRLHRAGQHWASLRSPFQPGCCERQLGAVDQFDQRRQEAKGNHAEVAPSSQKPA